jgi:hypothetical protein
MDDIGHPDDARKPRRASGALIVNSLSRQSRGFAVV